MPTCPGCYQQLTYAELRSHVRGCLWIWSEAPRRENGWNEHVAAVVREFEE